MRRLRSFSSLFVATLLALGAWTSVAHADDVASVTATTQKYLAAFNAGDAKAFMQYWAEDADYTNSEGETFRGRDAIAKLMGAIIEDQARDKLSITEESARGLKPGVVIQDGVLVFTMSDGSTDRSRFSAVWVESKGNWSLASVRDLGSLPSTGPTVPREHPLETLAKLQGKWIAKDEQRKVELNVDWMLGSKQFLKFEYLVEAGNAPNFTVLQIVGWDPIDQTVRSWFFDSLGGHGTGLWSQTDQGWLVLSSGTTPTGQLAGGVYEYTISPKSIVMKMSQREVAGEPQPDAEATFEKH